MRPLLSVLLMSSCGLVRSVRTRGSLPASAASESGVRAPGAGTMARARVGAGAVAGAGAVVATPEVRGCCAVGSFILRG